LKNLLLEQLKEGKLKFEDVKVFLLSYLNAEIDEEEVIAFLRELASIENPEIIKTYIEAIVATGTSLSWPENLKPIIDKHSTGGVGDKVSLVLTPLLTATGVRVAKLSGRSLGHTGGTIDKLEAIPGVNTSLTSEDFQKIVGNVGCIIAEPAKDICPVEAKLYDLRDRTGLIPYPSLVAASILSKKIAANADVLVFDVKYGKGAFFRELQTAEKVAKLLVKLASAFDKKASALLTSMENPLGYAVGNALEVFEAIEFLSGVDIPGLNEVVYALSVEALTSIGFDEEEAFIRLDAARKSNRALQIFVKMISALGGPSNLTDLKRSLPRAPYVGIFTSAERGYLHHVDPLLVSKAVEAASRGKRHPATGIKLYVKVGDQINLGDELAEIHAVDADALDKAADILEDAFLITEEKPLPVKYVYATIKD
jgi:pyrimidine-nucleoside phosphorylase